MSPTKPSSDLHKLILAMTPSEKRHFRIVNTGKAKSPENQFLLLFGVLENQDQPDDDVAMKRLKLKDRNRYSRIKNYLYKSLLESLEDYYREANGDAQFFHLINRAQILLGKRLFSQASRQLAKAEKIAAEKGNGTYSLIVLTLQLDRLTREENLDELQARLVDYAEIKSGLLQRTGDFLDLYMIKSKATWLLRCADDTNALRREWLAELAKHPLLKELKYPDDTEFTLYHYNLNGLIHGLLGNPAEDYRNRLAYLNTYRNNPEYIQRWPVNYIIALGNVASSEGQKGDYSALFVCTEEMRVFLEREKIKNRSTLEPIALLRSRALELEAYPFLLPAQQTDLINRLERKFRENGHETAEVWQIIIRHGIGRHYFFQRSWSEALEWLSPVVHQSDDRLSPELQWSARIFYTLTHFEMRNDRYVESYLPKVRQWMRIRKLQWEPVNTLLQHIRGALHQYPRPRNPDMLAELAEAFALPEPGLANSPDEQHIHRLRQLLNLRPWLLGKLTPVKQPRR